MGVYAIRLPILARCFGFLLALFFGLGFQVDTTYRIATSVFFFFSTHIFLIVYQSTNQSSFILNISKPLNCECMQHWSDTIKRSTYVT